MNKPLSILILIALTLPAMAQLPETDIWLFKIARVKNKPPALEDGKNITSRPGYDNQPSFSPDGKRIYFSSVRNGDQSDIYVYTIGSSKTRSVTNSGESEYSPVLQEKTNLITSVTVEKDSAQRVHFINPETGVHEQKFETDSIGYYSFLNADTVLYYKLTNPHTLRYYVRSNNEDRFIAASPVRSFGPLTRHSAYFGMKDSAGVTVYIYDFHLRKSVQIATYDNLGEDLQYYPEWGLLRSSGTSILQYDETGKGWKELFNLGASGVKKITRFTIDKKSKYLAVVDNL